MSHPSEYIKDYDKIPMGSWYKDGYFWRKKLPDGADGKGDLIFNTCYRIIQQKDKSEWAYKALDACSLLLLDLQRWPDRMDQVLDAESRVERFINRMLRKLGFKYKWYEYRFQGRMSRDPFIAFYTLAVFLEEPGYIEAVPMVWHVYSPRTFRWRRRLINDKRDIAWIRVDCIRSLGKVLNHPDIIEL